MSHGSATVRRWAAVLGLIGGFALLVGQARAVGPAAVYLTWTGDPTRCMTIHYHVEHGVDVGSTVWYRRPGTTAWQSHQARSHSVPGLDRQVYTAQLDRLMPDTRYAFRIGGDPYIRQFATMPTEPTRPIRFAVGGDVYRDHDRAAAMFDQLAGRDMDFVVLGGDIVGDAGLAGRAGLWANFLEMASTHLVAADNRLIPMIPVIGNHEVTHGGFGRTAVDAPNVHAMFAYPPMRGYGVVDLGDYLSLLTLNSGHTASLDGEQSDWLDQTLSDRRKRHVMHTFAVYHVPAWPAERSANLPSHRAVRDHFIPLFDRYQLDAAFEHHEHTYKRTLPLRNGEVDPYGTIYLGNGGVSEIEGRDPDPPGSWANGGRWYLARSAQTNHMILVTVDGPYRSFQAISPAGHTIDQLRVRDGWACPIVYAGSARLPGPWLVWLATGTSVLAGVQIMGLALWWRTRQAATGRAGLPWQLTGAGLRWVWRSCRFTTGQWPGVFRTGCDNATTTKRGPGQS